MCTHPTWRSQNPLHIVSRCARTAHFRGVVHGRRAGSHRMPGRLDINAYICIAACILRASITSKPHLGTCLRSGMRDRFNSLNQVNCEQKGGLWDSAASTAVGLLSACTQVRVTRCTREFDWSTPSNGRAYRVGQLATASVCMCRNAEGIIGAV